MSRVIYTRADRLVLSQDGVHALRYVFVPFFAACSDARDGVLVLSLTDFTHVPPLLGLSTHPFLLLPYSLGSTTA